jgi:hypothetical protein
MKKILFVFLILSTSLNAQEIEKIDFMGTWLLLVKESNLLSSDTIILYKTENNKQIELKQNLSKQNTDISEVLFLPNRLYFNPYNANCECTNQSELSWKWKINIKQQTINIEAVRKKKNKFKILSFEKSIFNNEFNVEKLILVRIES